MYVYTHTNTYLVNYIYMYENYFVTHGEMLLRISFSVFRNPVVRDQEVMTGKPKWPIN